MTKTIEDYRKKFEYIRGSKDILKWFKNPTTTHDIISIDIETYAKENYKGDWDSAFAPVKSKIRTLQLFDGEECVILDFMELDGSYTLVDKAVVDKLQEFLLSKTLVAHNAIFETSHLQNLFSIHYLSKVKPLNIICTMNMFNLLKHAGMQESEGVKATLQAVVDQVLGIMLPKEADHNDWGVVELSKEQLEYCMFDVTVLPDVFEKLLADIKVLGMGGVLELNAKAQEAVSHMKIHGVAFNTVEHKKLYKGWKKRKEELEIECFDALNEGKGDLNQIEAKELITDKVVKKYHEFIGRVCVSLQGKCDITTLVSDLRLCERMQEREHDANKRRALRRVVNNLKTYLVMPSSTKQKSEWFRAHLSEDDLEDWPESEKSGHLKMDHDTLKEFSHIPVAELLDEYSTYSKLTSTYGESLESYMIKRDGVTYIYPNFTLCFTGTGRMSSFEPNFQNFPRSEDIRRLFCARAEDRKLLCADFSQIEVRVAAELSKDSVMRAAYAEGKDIHKITAAAMSGKRLEDVTKEERQAGKACVFGLLFGAGGATLKRYAKKSYGVEMTQAEADAAVETFRTTYPEYRKWQREQSTKAEEHGVVITPSGKVRALEEDKTYTTSMNTPIQGGAGEIMLHALVNIWTYIQENDVDAYLVNVVHDEVIVDCHEDDVEEMSKAIVEGMEQALLTVFPTATTRDLVEVGVGSNWAEAK